MYSELAVVNYKQTSMWKNVQLRPRGNLVWRYDGSVQHGCRADKPVLSLSVANCCPKRKCLTQTAKMATQDWNKALTVASFCSLPHIHFKHDLTRWSLLRKNLSVSCAAVLSHHLYCGSLFFPYFLFNIFKLSSHQHTNTFLWLTATVKATSLERNNKNPDFSHLSISDIFYCAYNKRPNTRTPHSSC